VLNSSFRIGKVTHLSGKILRVVLFVYGAASFLGNLLAAKLLSKNAMKTAIFYLIVIGLIVSGIGVHRWHANNHLEWIDSLPVYSTAKYYANVWLESSGLDYTNIRPGSPTNNPGTGKVKVADNLEHKQISREDVASAIIALLENDQTIGKALELVGGVTPIEEVLRTL
jgi:NAD(P)H-binding